ncbi:hypothetical protein ACJ73_10298 [Blastomyces percursus]|uniref:Uncharacterized protein n=1 Tax=Blastomyces percursus TaxID=1658174 RepID=A0A1J9PZM6_9EURO|nr:hypothetical protein ACJ73_10298 [Blastomyces percursus]
MWWNVVQAQTDEIFIEAWDKLKAEYKDDYPEVVRYIEKEWLTESTKHHLLNSIQKRVFIWTIKLHHALRVLMQ